MVKLSSINDFFSCKNYAFIGISSSGDKFSNSLYEELKKKNFTLFPVNPNINEYEEDKCYENVKDIQENIEGAIILTPKIQTELIIKDCLSKGIKHIWIQQGAENDDAIKYAKENNINVIYKECVFMYAEPVTSIHAFHRWFKKLFGKYPK
ncbi:MAG: CoA-binding protein [Bacteroidales bacterium]|nr:CoA-binding protein [Bacteroidales bacterium]